MKFNLKPDKGWWSMGVGMFGGIAIGRIINNDVKTAVICLIVAVFFVWARAINQ